MSRKVASGGFDDHPPATRSIYAPRDSILLPPSRPVFEPLDLEEPETNKFSLFESLLVSFLTGVAFVAAVVLLFT